MKDRGKQQPEVKKMEFKFKFSTKRILVWLLVLMLFLPFLFSLLDPTGILPKIGLSQAIADIKDSKVQSMEIRGDEVMLKYSETDLKVTRKEEGSSWVETLQREGVDAGKVKIEVASQETGKLIGSILVNVLPILGFGVILYMMTRQARGTQDSVFGFGKSKAKLFAKGKQNVKFGDVAGVDEAKKELEEVVDFLKHPKKFRILGARTPKGVLLVGPSGVGKTLLARAVAGEANVPFFSMAGSEFMEMFVGVGASRVRDLFLTAKKSAPAIVFIDELDAIGRMRGGGNSMGGHDEREQTLNQILVEMDGFTMNDNVIVLAATNRPDVLDPALVRPGRFDRRVSLDLPDIEGRQEILKIHAKNKPFEKNVDWRKIAKRTVGFSGADLENMLNEAAIQAARGNKKEIDMSDLEEAATKVKLGPEKKRLQSELDRKMTAYHESGHAVVSYFSKYTDAVHRISIVSRGMALGYTLSPPEKDRLHETKSHLIDEIAMTMGGRAAEQLIFNEMTSGAANDIDQATRIARYMVMEFGMSDLGPINFGPQMDVTEWGKSLSEAQQISPEMLSKIDTEVQKFVNAGYKEAVDLLKKHKKQLDIIAKELIKKETVEGEEFEALMGGPKKKVE